MYIVMNINRSIFHSSFSREYVWENSM